MRHGMAPKEACLDALKRVARNFNNDLGKLSQFDLNFYALRKDGEYAGASLWSERARNGRQVPSRYAVNDGTGNPATPDGNNWTGAAWDLKGDHTDGFGPWTWIAQLGIHPNGTNSAPNHEHWSIRRWKSDRDIKAEITWHMRKENPNGTGVTGIAARSSTFERKSSRSQTSLSLASSSRWRARSSWASSSSSRRTSSLDPLIERELPSSSATASSGWVSPSSFSW
jgi:hypothetical protein